VRRIAPQRIGPGRGAMMGRAVDDNLSEHGLAQSRQNRSFSAGW
jgi:hypothetical protein